MADDDIDDIDDMADEDIGIELTAEDCAPPEVVLEDEPHAVNSTAAAPLTPIARPKRTLLDVIAISAKLPTSSAAPHCVVVPSQGDSPPTVLQMGLSATEVYRMTIYRLAMPHARNVPFSPVLVWP